jgi:hypothetical protein
LNIIRRSFMVKRVQFSNDGTKLMGAGQRKHGKDGGVSRGYFFQRKVTLIIGEKEEKFNRGSLIDFLNTKLNAKESLNKGKRFWSSFPRLDSTADNQKVQAAFETVYSPAKQTQGNETGATESSIDLSSSNAARSLSALSEPVDKVIGPGEELKPIIPESRSEFQKEVAVLTPSQQKKEEWLTAWQSLADTFSERVKLYQEYLKDLLEGRISTDPNDVILQDIINKLSEKPEGLDNQDVLAVVKLLVEVRLNNGKYNDQDILIALSYLLKIESCTAKDEVLVDLGKKLLAKRKPHLVKELVETRNGFSSIDCASCTKLVEAYSSVVQDNKYNIKEAYKILKKDHITPEDIEKFKVIEGNLKTNGGRLPHAFVQTLVEKDDSVGAFPLIQVILLEYADILNNMGYNACIEAAARQANDEILRALVMSTRFSESNLYTNTSFWFDDGDTIAEKRIKRIIEFIFEGCSKKYEIKSSNQGTYQVTFYFESQEQLTTILNTRLSKFQGGNQGSVLDLNYTLSTDATKEFARFPWDRKVNGRYIKVMEAILAEKRIAKFREETTMCPDVNAIVADYLKAVDL